jgi:anaerobic ribonucleoside-triphosphate reductase activating protein
MVVFREIPDEVTLAINITGCPCHCKGCHSPFLWEDTGTELTFEELDRLIYDNKGISCVCFMGGDREPEYINELAKHIVKNPEFDNIAIGWYSGRNELSKVINLNNFDYIKLGRYIEELGGLDHETTNQRLYKIICEEDGKDCLKDITPSFWRKKP